LNYKKNDSNKAKILSVIVRKRNTSRE